MAEHAVALEMAGGEGTETGLLGLARRQRTSSRFSERPYLKRIRE